MKEEIERQKKEEEEKQKQIELDTAAEIAKMEAAEKLL